MRSSILTLTALVHFAKEGWKALKSRDHIIYAVFPFGPQGEEVMLHGRSHNVDVNDKASTFTWAARMHFRTIDGKVLIDKYTVIPVGSPLSGKLSLDLS